MKNVLKTRPYVSRPYRATPYNSNDIRSKCFRTLKEAEKYLNNVTGYNLKGEDWKLIGKIKKLCVKRNVGFFYGTYNGSKYI